MHLKDDSDLQASRPIRPLPTLILVQTGIHITFLMSAMAIAYTDKLLSAAHQSNSHH